MEYGSRLRRMDVMILDPETVSRGKVGALVRDFGCYNVRPFDNVEKAIVSIITKPPSIVLCNYDPNGEFASTVLDHIRRHGTDVIAQTPIILVSKSVDKTMISNSLQMGATQFLASPVVPAELIKKLVFVLKDNRQMVRQIGRLTYVPIPKRKTKPTTPKVQVIEFPIEASVRRKKKIVDDDNILEL